MDYMGSIKGKNWPRAILAQLYHGLDRGARQKKKAIRLSHILHKLVVDPFERATNHVDMLELRGTVGVSSFICPWLSFST